MKTTLPRWLLAIAALLLLLCATLHTSVFPRASSGVAASNLTIFLSQALKALWLIDSVTLSVLAVVFGLVTARPALASGLVVAFLALVPAGTAILLYCFLGGSFRPGHFLLLAAALAFSAGVLRIPA